jgi:mono/diheme cytochrome c family protein
MMIRSLRHAILAAVLLDGAARADDAGLQFFERRIRPVLAAECIDCHNVEKRKGGLALDHRAGWEKGGDTGPAIVRNKPDDSLLVTSIRHADPDLKMPKKAPKLDDAVIADFVAWVKMGAPDPREHPQPVTASAKKPWRQLLAERSQWWSFQPLGDPPIPPGDAAHPIDRFLKTQPAPADPRTLIRRLAFTLTGLPPTPDEVDRFVSDFRSDSHSTLDSQLSAFLSSPRFGEHFARHWMDVVRYADTHGSEHDLWNPWAWRYRDYLIRAFAADVPYDRFVREQIAGDLLPEPRWLDNVNESVIGTAMHRFVEYYDTPVDPKREEAIVIDNQIDTLGKAFQGLTLGCARCHDHKFDPVSARDYYALYGVFAGSRAAMHILDAPEALCGHDAELRRLREEVRTALAAQWREELRALPVRFREILREEKGPLQPLRTLAKKAEAEFASAFAEARRAQPAATLPAGAVVFADFGAKPGGTGILPVASAEGSLPESAAGPAVPLPRGWRVSGPGLPDSPSRAGFLSLGAENSPPLIRAIQPAGYFSDFNSARHGGSLRSPDFTIEKKYVSILATGRGGARARLVVENFQGERLLYAPAHPELKSFTTQWVTMTLRANWPGRRAYLEFVTGDDRPFVDVLKDPVATLGANDGRSMFGLVRVIFHDGPPPGADPELPAAVWNAEPATWSDFAAHFARVADSALTAWIENRATDDDARLLTTLVNAGALQTGTPANSAGARLVAEFHAMEKSIPRAQRAPGLRDDGTGRDHPLLARGDHTKPGEPVPRRWIEALGHAPIPDRLALANEIARADNPLTARVMANRVWQWLFGRGLVPTSDNFGRLGEKPEHPELLDHLAARFIADRWSLKKLIRYIVTSQAWQTQSSARRLEAESIRDAILAVSGDLKPDLFGPSVPVFWRTELDGENQPKPGPLDGAGRRSIYLDVRRKFPSEFLATFDFPKTVSATGRRDSTNVPAQSLALLNDPFVQAESRRFAERVSRECVLDEARIERMYALAFARPPRPDEMDRALAFLKSGASLPDLAHALLNMKEFVFVR